MKNQQSILKQLATWFFEPKFYDETPGYSRFREVNPDSYQDRAKYEFWYHSETETLIGFAFWKGDLMGGCAIVEGQKEKHEIPADQYKELTSEMERVYPSGDAKRSPLMNS